MDDKEFLQHFEELKKKNYLKASQNIVRTLLVLDHSSSKKANSEIFGSSISNDLDYSLQKLIKGTFTNNTTIQINFSTPLTQILKKFENIDIEKFLEYIVKESSLKKALSKKEKNHFIFGKMLCIVSLVKSKRIDNSSNAEHIFSHLYDLLLNDMKKFDWVNEPSSYVIEQTFVNSEKNLKMKTKLLINKLKQVFNTNDYNSLKLLISFHFAYKNSNQNFPYENLIENRILNKKALKGILIELIQIFPRKHEILKSVIKYMREYSMKKEFWLEFWKYFIKEFSGENASHKQYFILLSLFKYFIKHKDFSLNDFECIMNEDLISLW